LNWGYRNWGALRLRQNLVRGIFAAQQANSWTLSWCLGQLISALLGTVTPFCSCSLLIGIFRAKVFPYILIGAVIHNWIPAE
jgi:hypothetical protein